MSVTKMKLGQIKVDCVFYNVKKNIRVPMTQVFSNEEYANNWIEHLKMQDDVVWIEAYKQTKHGEQMILYWW